MSLRGPQEYLEDGIYVHDLGFQIKIHTPRETGDHFIFFEPPGLWMFLRWLRFRGKLPDEMLEQLRAYTPNGPEELKEDDLGGLENSTDEE